MHQYQRRPSAYENLSLHAYYQIFREYILKKPYSIPHYVGIVGTPVYPVTKEYARHVLTVYKPWREQPVKSNWIAEFESFIRSPFCATSARLNYDRVMQRFYDGTKHVDPKATPSPSFLQPPSEDDQEALLLSGLAASAIDITDLTGVERGDDFNWDQPPLVRMNTIDGSPSVQPKPS